MPLYKEWDSDAYSLAAIWKIEEPESFFIDGTGIDIPDIRNNKRRIERLAGRFLLKYLEQDFPLHHIMPDEHDKPRIDGDRFYFSISHSWPYVAAVVSPYVEAGIDIQCWHPRVEQIQHKFLSPAEQQMVGADSKMITLAWSAKEAVYKWQGRRGVEFIDHLPIQSIQDKNINIFSHLTTPKRAVSVKGFLEDDFSCAYVIHEEIFHPFNKSK
jgi:phosphopantetheinyl transferase